MILFAGDHLRSRIARRSTRCFEQLIGLVGVAEAKVHNFQAVFPVNKEILRFQISVDNVEAVQVGHPTDDLLKIFACLCFLDFRIFNDKVKQLTVLDILHN